MRQVRFFWPLPFYSRWPKWLTIISVTTLIVYVIIGRLWPGFSFNGHSQILGMFPSLLHRSESFDKCMEDSGLMWQEHQTTAVWTMMAVPQFEKWPTGFAARCDWIIGSRQSLYRYIPWNSSWWNLKPDPKTVFVRTDLLQYFFHKVLPCIYGPFVLISGDQDTTAPRQLDIRYPKNMNSEVWKKLHEDKRLLHHFAEHIDAMGPKLSPIPVGLNPIEFPKKNADFIIPHIQHSVNFDNRKLKVLRSDRIRQGNQWLDRERVKDFCDTAWSSFCDGLKSNTAPGVSYFKTLMDYAFVVCPHGGGLDPNPKAFEAILMGTVPIIKHFPGDSYLRKLPVVLVDEWYNETITLESLKSWMSSLRRYYESHEERARVIQKLESAYWWEKVQAKLHGLNEPSEEDIYIEWRPEPDFQSTWKIELTMPGG